MHLRNTVTPYVADVGVDAWVWFYHIAPYSTPQKATHICSRGHARSQFYKYMQHVLKCLLHVLNSVLAACVQLLHLHTGRDGRTAEHDATVPTGGSWQLWGGDDELHPPAL